MYFIASNKCDLMLDYSDWLFKRLAACRVCLSSKKGTDIPYDFVPSDLDCVVFKTRNPTPFLNKISSLDYLGYKSFFEIYLSPYNEKIERNIGIKKEILSSVKSLAKKIGKERVVWHYSPFFITDDYTPEFHKKAFERLCKALQGCCREVIVDFYHPNYKSEINTAKCEEKAIKDLIFDFLRISKKYNLDFTAQFEKDESNNTIRLIKDIYNIDVNDKPFIDLGEDNICSGNCSYCEKRDDIKMNKFLSQHNSDNVRLDGTSSLPFTASQKKKTSKYNDYNTSL